MTSSERAEACLAALDDAGRATARRVFLRLIRFGDGEADTRRRQPMSALGGGDDPARFTETLRRLTDARLLEIDGEEGAGDAVVDLADEALITSWPTLQAWIRAHGQTEQLRRQLETEAAAWRADHGDRDGLLDRGQLHELAGWLTADTHREIGVSDAAASFIAASRAEARHRRWPGTGVLGSVLAILLMLLILATPIILLFVVVLTAFVIHRFGLFG
jgi:hypothetical protein